MILPLFSHHTSGLSKTVDGLTMPSAKEQIAKILQDQPDDSSYDEILQKLIFVRMVEKGLADADAGQTISHEEMKRRIRTWRS